jgi:HSP20 family protein
MADQKTNTTAKQAGSSQESSQSSQLARSSQSGGLSRRSYDPFFLSPREFFSANPFSLMRRMTEEMDRVFGEFGFERGQSGRGSWSPAIEVAEREGNYVVHAELPGLKPEDVKVELSDDALVIHGERKSEHEENKGGVHRTERRYGQFYRTVPLPEGVNAEQVRAKFENGVLEVTVPVPQQQSTRRQIPINTGSESSTSSAASGTSAASAGSGSSSAGAGSGSSAKGPGSEKSSGAAGSGSTAATA